MGIWNLLFNPETKAVYVSLPTPIFHALETYAYMEKIETDEAIEEAILYFLNKKLYTVKKKEQTVEWKFVNENLAIRQERNK